MMVRCIFARMRLEEVEKDPAVRNILRKRRLRPSTWENYLKGIADFCEFLGATPSQVVEKVKAMDEDELIDLFSEWFISRKNSIAPKTMNKLLGGVRIFLLDNGVRAVYRVGREIAREMRNVFGAIRPLVRRDLITKEEIIRLLHYADLRERAIITLLASSGLRVSAAASLRLRNIRDNIWDESLPCYAIEIQEEISKEGEPYITFMSWECAEYIRELLRERERKGETLTPDSPLFITRYHKQISASRIENIFRDLCERAGVDRRPVTTPGRHAVPGKGNKTIYRQGVIHNIRVHSLRKFFRTTLQISGVDRMVAEALMGHSLSQFGVESVYNYAVGNLDYLRSEYMKAVNNLLFLRKPRGLEVMNHVARKRIEELDHEVEDLRSKLDQTMKMLFILGEELAKRRPKLAEKMGVYTGKGGGFSFTLIKPEKFKEYDEKRRKKRGKKSKSN